jgi:hypothetical protein
MICEYTMTTTEKLNWLREYREALRGLAPTHMVTINFPRPLTGTRDARQEKIFVLLREWNRAVLKKLFGKKFGLRNSNNTFLFVGFTEVGPLMAKEHVHLLVRVPEHLRSKFEAHAANLWRPREVVAGIGEPGTILEPDILVQRFSEDRGGVKGAIAYCTKHLTPSTEGVVWSCDFRTQKSAT